MIPTPASPERLLRLKDVKVITNLSGSTILRKVAAGDFAPVARFGRTLRFPEHALREWIQSRIQG